MLGDHLIFPILLSTGLAKSREFYHDTLGLAILREDDERTQLAWRVSDLRTELADPRTRGARIEAYTAPDPETDPDGVADMGFASAAWITDPSRNVLAIIQPKGQPAWRGFARPIPGPQAAARRGRSSAAPRDRLRPNHSAARDRTDERVS